MSRPSERDEKISSEESEENLRKLLPHMILVNLVQNGSKERLRLLLGSADKFGLDSSKLLVDMKSIADKIKGQSS